MLDVIMLGVIKQIVGMLSVMAPSQGKGVSERAHSSNKLECFNR
jgi:hypothetical protein